MIRLIAAIDQERGLAKQGVMPWFIPEDEQYFTEQTKQYGGAVLIGSTTFKTFKQPLVGRQNFVLTTDKEPISGVELVHDLEKFLHDFQDKDLWMVGGANVFSQIFELGKADELYLTHIEATFGCNQFFPAYQNTFSLVEKSELHTQHGFIFSYARYAKN